MKDIVIQTTTTRTNKLGDRLMMVTITSMVTHRSLNVFDMHPTCVWREVARFRPPYARQHHATASQCSIAKLKDLKKSYLWNDSITRRSALDITSELMDWLTEDES